MVDLTARRRAVLALILIAFVCVSAILIALRLSAMNGDRDRLRKRLTNLEQQFQQRTGQTPGPFEVPPVTTTTTTPQRSTVIAPPGAAPTTRVTRVPPSTVRPGTTTTTVRIAQEGTTTTSSTSTTTAPCVTVPAAVVTICRGG